MTNRTIVLSQEQFLIEQGLMWQISDSQNITGGATYYYGITTNGYWAMLSDRYFQTGSTDSSFTLYRDTSYTGGTDITLYNRNDNYATDTSKHPVSAVKHGVTASPNAADQVFQIILDTKTSLEREVGSLAAVNVFLKPSTNYVLAVSNVSGGPVLHRWVANITQWSLSNTEWRPAGT